MISALHLIQIGLHIPPLLVGKKVQGKRQTQLDRLRLLQSHRDIPHCRAQEVPAMALIVTYDVKVQPGHVH
jgi:hypothetical protein